MNKHWKIVIGALFILALGLVVFQRVYQSPKPLPKTETGAQSLEDFYQTAKNLAPQNQTTTSTATFLAVGDIMLSRNVALAIKNNSNPNFPFLKISDTLKSTNFNFANLESPVAPYTVPFRLYGAPIQDILNHLGNGGRAIIGGHSLIFAAPYNDVATLAKYDFEVLNLANNHALDQGPDGINGTLQTLNGLGIIHEGVGFNLDEAWQPAEVEAGNGIKICFIGASYSSINDGGKTTNDYVARIEDNNKLKISIDTAKSECDFVVVTMHAGTEYTRKPNSAQIAFAHAAIDDGADMVIGAHPHWVQTIEKYQGKYIFYSLGNFIFDQNFSEDVREGLALKITINKTGVGADTIRPLQDMKKGDDLQGPRQPARLDSIQLLPVIIQNSQPRPATAEETKNILQKIGETKNILTP